MPDQQTEKIRPVQKLCRTRHASKWFLPAAQFAKYFLVETETAGDLYPDGQVSNEDWAMTRLLKAATLAASVSPSIRLPPR